MAERITSVDPVFGDLLYQIQMVEGISRVWIEADEPMAIYQVSYTSVTTKKVGIDITGLVMKIQKEKEEDLTEIVRDDLIGLTWENLVVNIDLWDKLAYIYYYAYPDTNAVASNIFMIVPYIVNWIKICFQVYVDP